ncbi:hypothetical protein RhiirB3_455578, partial [Rhizophagus irregularis]
IKREKLYENEDYLTAEIDLDIDVNFNNNGYITKEIDFDIDTLNYQNFNKINFSF